MLLDSVFQAVSKGQGITELEEYLRHDGKINRRNPISGWTMLHQAREHKNHRVIAALIRRGADVNATAADGSGTTPLHVAVDIDIDSAVQWTADLTQVTFTTVYGYHSSLADRFDLLLKDITLK